MRSETGNSGMEYKDIIIWGAGSRGKGLMKACVQDGRTVRAFVDNDRKKWGKKIENISILSPVELSEPILSNAQIWIATAAPEVYRQALGINENVIEWNLVECFMMRRHIMYPKISVKDRNLKNCKVLEDRITFLHKLEREARNWKMAEVGVAFGDYSEQIIKICNPKKLYLIDLWGTGYEDGFASVSERFENEIREGRIEIRRGYSIDQLQSFPDGELDFAYIDTVHDYETTKMELELCDKKVKNGGYICGHDYTGYNMYGGAYYGVYDAVNEFAVDFDYEFLYLTLEWHGLQTFALRKLSK